MDARFVDSLLAPGPHPSLGEDAGSTWRLETEFRVRRTA